jgi:hypothetical protein
MGIRFLWTTVDRGLAKAGSRGALGHHGVPKGRKVSSPPALAREPWRTRSAIALTHARAFLAG